MANKLSNNEHFRTTSGHSPGPIFPGDKYFWVAIMDAGANR